MALSASENPLVDPTELESIRLQTAEHVWRQEYLAKFTDSAGQVFRDMRDIAFALALYAANHSALPISFA